LKRHHPELNDVWGDLEANIKIIEPTKAKQPANLKLTLLPFQCESLYWMRKQEKGIWHGGMLAVSLLTKLRSRLELNLDHARRMKWGEEPSDSQSQGGVLLTL
jgi:hypothetical protein